MSLNLLKLDGGISWSWANFPRRLTLQLGSLYFRAASTETTDGAFPQCPAQLELEANTTVDLQFPDEHNPKFLHDDWMAQLITPQTRFQSPEHHRPPFNT